MGALIHSPPNTSRMVLRIFGSRPNRKLASAPLSKRAEKSAPSMTSRGSPSPPAKFRISNGGLNFLVRVPGPCHNLSLHAPVEKCQHAWSVDAYVLLLHTRRS